MPNRLPSFQASGKASTAEDTADVSDPYVLELTREELGYRTAYNQRNGLVYRRRRQILEKLGLSPTEIDAIVQSTQRQLRDFQPRLEYKVVLKTLRLQNLTMNSIQHN